MKIGAPEGHMKTVLVVDNNPGVPQMIEAALCGYGFAVKLATCGIDALEIFRHGHVHFVLLNVKMPEMDGTQILAALKAIDPNVRCSFMSSSSAASGVAGAVGFLQKPFSLEELRKIVVNNTM